MDNKERLLNIIEDSTEKDKSFLMDLYSQFFGKGNGTPEYVYLNSDGSKNYYKGFFKNNDFDLAVDMCIKHAIYKIHKDIDEKVKIRNTMRCIQEFGILPIENN